MWRQARLYKRVERVSREFRSPSVSYLVSILSTLTHASDPSCPDLQLEDARNEVGTTQHSQLYCGHPPRSARPLDRSSEKLT
jgi:hypothetical protein